MIKTNDMVAVNNEIPGVVKYITADGWYGVSLAGEHGRVDEWQACQVRKITPEEGGKMAAKLFPFKK